jgi:predicted ATP-dependent protease
MFGDDLKDYDIHIQFLQTYEGVEGDSASITVATAILSAIFALKTIVVSHTAGTTDKNSIHSGSM